MLGALLSIPVMLHLAGASPRRPQVPPQAARAFADRLWQVESFVGSSQWRNEKQSLHRFFDDDDYRRLRGNDVLGYWSLDAGFTGAGTVELTSIKTLPGCARIKTPAWRAAFALATGSPASPPQVNLSVGCLEAVYTQTSASPPGVLIEFRFVDKHGRQFRYRSAIGKASLEAAMVASFEWAIQLSKTVQGEPRP